MERNERDHLGPRIWTASLFSAGESIWFSGEDSEVGLGAESCGGYVAEGAEYFGCNELCLKRWGSEVKGTEYCSCCCGCCCWRCCCKSWYWWIWCSCCWIIFCCCASWMRMASAVAGVRFEGSVNAGVTSSFDPENKDCGSDDKWGGPLFKMGPMVWSRFESSCKGGEFNNISSRSCWDKSCSLKVESYGKSWFWGVGWNEGPTKSMSLAWRSENVGKEGFIPKSYAMRETFSPTEAPSWVAKGEVLLASACLQEFADSS